MKPDLALALYPNPNNGHLFFESSDPDLRFATYELMTVDGKNVGSGEADLYRGLNIEDYQLASGTYFIRLYSAELHIFVTKMFVLE